MNATSQPEARRRLAVLRDRLCFSHLRTVGGARSISLLATAIRFGLAGMLSSLGSFVLPLILHEFLGVPERWSVAIAFGFAYVINFVTLRRVVFASDRDWKRDLTFYAVLNAAFRGSEFMAFSFLRQMNFASYAATLLIVLAGSTIIKFFAYRFLFSGMSGPPKRLV
jgi:putative flippase GtrA